MLQLMYVTIHWNEFIINIMYIVPSLYEMVEFYWKYN